MSRLGRAWTCFWFPRVPLERLALVRVVLCGWVAFDVLLYRTWIDRASAPAFAWSPYGPLRWLHAPRLGPGALTALWAVALVAALAGAIGWRTRVALPVLAASYVWWVLEYSSYGKPMHARTPLVTGLVALTVAPCARVLSLDTRRRSDGRPTRTGAAATVADDERRAGWCCQVLAVSLVYLYVTAGVAKLRAAGFGWWHGNATQAGIALFGPDWAASFSAAHPAVVDGAALLALAWELAAPVLLWRGRLRSAYAATAVLFHLAVLTVMRIDFLAMAAVCVALLPLERALATVHVRTRRRRAPFTLRRERSTLLGPLQPEAPNHTSA